MKALSTSLTALGKGPAPLRGKESSQTNTACGHDKGAWESLLALGTKPEVYPILLCPSETAFQYHSVQPAQCSTLEQLPQHPQPSPAPQEPDLTAVGSVKHLQETK